MAEGSLIAVRVIASVLGEEIDTFHLPPSATINDVKIQVEACHGTNRLCQCLILAGDNVPLEDDQSLGGLHPPLELSYTRIARTSPEDVDIGLRVLSAATDGDIVRMNQLLRLPAWPEYTDDQSNTPLIIAAVHGHSEVTRSLLEAGAEKDRPGGENGWTPLNTAAHWGHAEVVQLLCEAGADMDKFDEEDCTPLDTAAFWGYAEVVQLLLDAGAEKDRCADVWGTPLSSALWQQHTEVVRVLSEAGADKDKGDPLYTASILGHVKIVRQLVDLGVEIDKPAYNGCTALGHAASDGHIEVVRLLSEAGAEKDKPDIYGKTPMYYAAEYGHFEVTRFLSVAGAEKEKVAKDGTTPLHIAVFCGHSEIGRLLSDGHDFESRQHTTIMEPLRPSSIPSSLGLPLGFWCTCGTPGLKRNDGKLYHEVSLGEGMDDPWIGWLTDQFSIGPYDGIGVGCDTMGWAWRSHGEVNWKCHGCATEEHEGSIEEYEGSKPWDVGDTVGCAIDMKVRRMQVSVGGEWNDSATMTFADEDESTSFYPAISICGMFRMHIGRKSWQYAPPDNDYEAWSSDESLVLIRPFC